MPTVLRLGPYRFYFYSHEPNEPPHIHVDYGGLSAKFWIQPVSLARNMGYAAHQLRDVPKMVELHHSELLEAWHGYFGAEG